MKGEIDSVLLRKSIVFFPLVGLMLGGILVGLGFLLAGILPYTIVKLLLVIFLVIITAGLHLDGLADTIDAIASRKSREEALRIMKESTIGPMGVMAIVGCLLLKYFSFFEISGYRAYLFFPMIGRMAMVIACRAFPYAREEGTGKAFIGNVSNFTIVVVLLISFVTSFVLMYYRGIIIMGIVIVLTVIAGKYFVEKFGGITGDNLGFINEVGEIIALIGILV